MAVRIQLIVTGDLERRLPTWLEKLFPASDVCFLEAQYLNGITSTTLPPEPAAGSLKGMEMVGALLAAVDPGRTGVPADFAIAIDDVELENMGNEEAIYSHIRAAATHTATVGPCNSEGIALARAGSDSIDVVRGRQITRPLNTLPRRSEALRGRCSFHLLSPMLEGPLFADASAIRAARTSPPVHRSLFQRAACDPEGFLVNDPEYQSVPDDHLPEGAAFPVVWARPGRERHPKNYLRFLLDPGGKNRRAYRETREGLAALTAWDPYTITHVPGQMARLRSLLHDIADMAGVHLPAAFGTAPPRSSTVLRNL